MRVYGKNVVKELLQKPKSIKKTRKVRALEIDEQTRKIIEECYEKAKKIIKENKNLIFQLSDALMKYETITKEQIESIVKTGKIKPVEETANTDSDSSENTESGEKKSSRGRKPKATEENAEK